MGSAWCAEVPILSLFSLAYPILRTLFSDTFCELSYLQDGLKNLFSAAGNVVNSRVIKPKFADSSTTYGYVYVFAQ